MPLYMEECVKGAGSHMRRGGDQPFCVLTDMALAKPQGVEVRTHENAFGRGEQFARNTKRAKNFARAVKGSQA